MQRRLRRGRRGCGERPREAASGSEGGWVQGEFSAQLRCVFLINPLIRFKKYFWRPLHNLTAPFIQPFGLFE